ncbi:MAG: WD40 repeat domain-containing protein [Anaerolineae bacterium]|nr:WD40 repeat domain-containing protein [Anaerolineae bacterium]
MKKLSLLTIVLALMGLIGISVVAQDESPQHPVITPENVTQIQELWVKQKEMGIYDVRFSPDSQYLVALTNFEGLWIYDVDNFDAEPRLLSIQDAIAMDISPDSQFIGVGLIDGSVQILDSVTGEIQHTFHIDVAPIQSIAYHPSGNLISTGSHEGVVRVIDIDSATEIYDSLNGEANPIRALAYSPDGQTLAFGNWRGSDACIFDVETGNREHCFSQLTFGVWSIAYSPDSQFIATTTNAGTQLMEIKIWQIEDETLAHSLTGHTSTIMDIAYSPDGQLLVSTGWDKVIRIWDTHTGIELAILEGHTDTGEQIAYSPDGRFIASTSYDRMLHIWGIPASDTP